MQCKIFISVAFTSINHLSWLYIWNVKLCYILSIKHITISRSLACTEKQKHHEKHPNTEKRLRKKSHLNTWLHFNEYLKVINPLLLDFLISTTTTISEQGISNTIKHTKKIFLYSSCANWCFTPIQSARYQSMTILLILQRISLSKFSTYRMC